MNKTTIKELQKVKLNVKNIHSVLINANKKQEKLSSSITDLEKREEQKKKFEAKERRLESPFSSSLDNIKKSVKPSGDEGGGNIFCWIWMGYLLYLCNFLIGWHIAFNYINSSTFSITS